MATWNVWFDPRHERRRMEAIAAALLKEGVEVVALQEATQSNLGVLLPALAAGGLTHVHLQQCLREGQLNAYGVALVSKFPLEATRAVKYDAVTMGDPALSSIMDRQLLAARVRCVSYATVYASSCGQAVGAL